MFQDYVKSLILSGLLKDQGHLDISKNVTMFHNTNDIMQSWQGEKVASFL